MGVSKNIYLYFFVLFFIVFFVNIWLLEENFASSGVIFEILNGGISAVLAITLLWVYNKNMYYRIIYSLILIILYMNILSGGFDLNLRDTVWTAKEADGNEIVFEFYSDSIQVTSDAGIKIHGFKIEDKKLILSENGDVFATYPIIIKENTISVSTYANELIFNRNTN